ncbi:MAG TPA: PPOX class F420-dependent oxidoreductase [Aggregatilineales bacterium]|nr:PPOX class F420-dependent oxidoreductase [Aggregatilineales bacterium]
MQDMTPDAYRRFMLEGPRTAKLATVRADGRPHVAPIWFDLDGEILVFTTGEDTVKGKNVRRDPRVNLCVDDDKPPFAYALIEGRAQILASTPAELLYWATRIAGRYMGPDLAEAYGKRNGVPGELLVRVTPTRVLARTGISDW